MLMLHRKDKKNMEIINFDYKKLESYKTAMDDGFIARNKRKRLGNF